MRKQNLCSIFASLIILFSVPLDVIAAAPYYEGKMITIIVGVGPGGGYDRIARLLAKHLPKYIPGKPTIIVSNMPGAGGIIAANYLYNIAKPNGLTIGTFNKGLPFAQLLKADGVRYDIKKYAWIGSAATEGTALILRTDIPYKTFNDLMKAKEPIYMGSPDVTGVGYQIPTLLKEFAGLNLKIAVYDSSASVMLAVERREVDGIAGSYSSYKSYIERGLVRPFARSRVSEPETEHLPVMEDFITDSKGKAVMAMLASVEVAGRPYVAPPGTPVKVMDTLRNAFAKVAKDPELVKESKRLMLEIKYIPGDQCLKVIDNVFNQPKDTVDTFGRYVKY